MRGGHFDVVPMMAESKFDTLTQEALAAFAPPVGLQSAMERLTRPGARVLDIGCGRGELVLWLREHGYDAHGADIVSAYLDAGRPLADALGHREVLHESTLDMPAGSFDLVVSHQVLEHVQDMEAMAREISRLTVPGGAGWHIFPAKWRPIEPHLHMPFVHWVRGRSRRLLVAGALRVGRDPGWGGDRPLDRYVSYLADHTHYRSVRQIAAAFTAAGMRSRVNMEGHRFDRRLPGWVIATLVTVQLEVVKPPRSDPPSAGP